MALFCSFVASALSWQRATSSGEFSFPRDVAACCTHTLSSSFLWVIST